MTSAQFDSDNNNKHAIGMQIPFQQTIVPYIDYVFGEEGGVSASVPVFG